MRVFKRSPLDTLHIAIVLSKSPDAKYFPLGENATLATLDLCPLKVLMRSPLYTFHSPILNFLQIPKVLSENPDAKYSPFGENATLDINCLDL